MCVFFQSDIVSRITLQLQTLLAISAVFFSGFAWAENVQGTGPIKESTPAAVVTGRESVSLEEQLAQLQKQKKKDASFSADFSARLYISRTKKVRLSTGKVQYRPPTQFRWEVTQPEAELYVATGTELWKYNARAKHAQKMPMNGAGLEFLQVLLDPIELAKRYEISPWQSLKETTSAEKNSAAEKTSEQFDRLPTLSGDFLFAKLIPKVKNGTEDYLYILANRSSGHVKEIRIAFKDGNRNTIAFDNWKQEALSEVNFRFDPPPGTAIDKL